MKKSFEQLLDGKELRRLKNDDKTHLRMTRLENKANELIGELCKEGKQVFYINLHPLRKGKILEGSKADLMAYLIRNKYV